MLLFLATIFLWSTVLLFLRPNPNDLQAKIPNYWESFRKIQATFWLGIFLIIVFFISSGGTFVEVNKNWFAILGVNNLEMFTPWWFVQTITHNFIHLNLLHLWANLSFLGILSLYERKVGASRFLSVFIFSGMLSSISLFFVATPIISAGASAGLFALAAAYLLDIPKLTFKEYLLGISMIIFLFLIFNYTESKRTVDTFEIDTWGHLFGLLFGLIFCKLFPRKAAIVL